MLVNRISYFLIMKVLFISTIPLYPVIGGAQIRTTQQLEFLISKYDVDVLYMSDCYIEDRTKEFLPTVDKVIKFYIPKYMCYLQTLKFLFNTLPLQVNYYYNGKVQKYIDQHLEEYDLVFCNNIRTAEYVRNAQCVIKYMDFVDAISMNYEKARHFAKGIKRIIYTIDYKRCIKYEQLILSTFDSCAIISNIDKEYILRT